MSHYMNYYYEYYKDDNPPKVKTNVTYKVCDTNNYNYERASFNDYESAYKYWLEQNKANPHYPAALLKIEVLKEC